MHKVESSLISLDCVSGTTGVWEDDANLSLTFARELVALNDFPSSEMHSLVQDRAFEYISIDCLFGVTMTTMCWCT